MAQSPQAATSSKAACCVLTEILQHTDGNLRPIHRIIAKRISRPVGIKPRQPGALRMATPQTKVLNTQNRSSVSPC